MKRNKKLIMALSFCVGVALFGTTVFADISAKTGYDEMKDAVKNSFQSYSENVNNFTMEASIIVKDNDKVVTSVNGTSKFDNANKKVEESSISQTSAGEALSSYMYRDQDSNIWYNAKDNLYYFTEYTKKNDGPVLENPFKEERAKDMEKIADALVGNLKDYVVVENKADESKELSGSLSETQIPALVNAVSSFFFKQVSSEEEMRNQEFQLPQLKDDIFIKSVNGNIIVNKAGLIENVLASGMLSGKDKEGNVHELSIEVLVKFVDINSTIVNKPDLTGKKVEKSTVTPRDEKSISNKFIGKYKNDIIIEKDGSFVKVGERIVQIAHIDGTHVSGRYYEVYKDEFKEQYAEKQAEFNFDAEIRDGYSAQFEYKEKGFNLTDIYFDTYGASVNFGGSAPDRFNYSFSKMFE